MSTVNDAKRLMKAEKEAAKHSMARNQISKGMNVFFNVLLIVFCILIIFPLWIIIVSSVTSEQALTTYGYRLWPLEFSVNAYTYLFRDGSIILTAYKNTLIATLTGFDEQLYEAGAIDGASKWQQFRYITLPQLMPVIVMLQILAVGRIFNGDFDMFYSLPNGSGTLRQVTSTIDVYVYDMLKKGNLRNSFGYAGAGAFFQSVVGFFLILITNGIVRRHQPDMALF